jgi:prolyl oligopeptidase
VLLWGIVGLAGFAQAIHGREGITLPPPPAVEAIPVVDDYFGTKILDSYRWLEDAKSPETRAFINAQNTYTGRYLKQARIREQVVDDLDALQNVTVMGAPLARANSFFSENGWPANSRPRSMYAMAGQGRTSG